MNIYIICEWSFMICVIQILWTKWHWRRIMVETNTWRFVWCVLHGSSLGSFTSALFLCVISTTLGKPWWLQINVIGGMPSVYANMYGDIDIRTLQLAEILSERLVYKTTLASIFQVLPFHNGFNVFQTLDKIELHVYSFCNNCNTMGHSKYNWRLLFLAEYVCTYGNAFRSDHIWHLPCCRCRQACLHASFI